MSSYTLTERINSDVNASVTYKSDLEQFGVPEFWQEAGKFGDCEDYALLKRALLLNAGWPQDKQFLACCWVETGEYHCILLCNTSKGWYNRYTWPMSPKSLPYRWDKALDEVDGKWYELSF
jgi:predicted transglutaminase-like cysteine proteinase